MKVFSEIGSMCFVSGVYDHTIKLKYVHYYNFISTLICALLQIKVEMCQQVDPSITCNLALFPSWLGESLWKDI